MFGIFRLAAMSAPDASAAALAAACGARVDALPGSPPVATTSGAFFWASTSSSPVLPSSGFSVEMPSVEPDPPWMPPPLAFVAAAAASFAALSGLAAAASAAVVSVGAAAAGSAVVVVVAGAAATVCSVSSLPISTPSSSITPSTAIRPTAAIGFQ